MASPGTKNKLSLLGKLDLLPALAAIITTGLLSLLTAFSRGQRGAPTLYLHVAYAILRKATMRLSVLQLQ